MILGGAGALRRRGLGNATALADLHCTSCRTSRPRLHSQDHNTTALHVAEFVRIRVFRVSHQSEFSRIRLQNLRSCTVVTGNGAFRREDCSHHWGRVLRHARRRQPRSVKFGPVASRRRQLSISAGTRRGVRHSSSRTSSQRRRPQYVGLSGPPIPLCRLAPQSRRLRAFSTGRAARAIRAPPGVRRLSPRPIVLAKTALVGARPRPD